MVGVPDPPIVRLQRTVSEGAARVSLEAKNPAAPSNVGDESPLHPVVARGLMIPFVAALLFLEGVGWVLTLMARVVHWRKR